MTVGPITVLTAEELQAFVDEAATLLQRLKGVRARPLSLGLLGVSLIQQAAEETKGDLAWWADFVRTGTLPAFPLHTDEGSQ